LLDPSVEDYLTWLTVERGRSRNTLSAYRRDLAAYQAFLSARAVTIAAASEADLVDFMATLRARGLAAASTKRTMVAVRNLHRFLATESVDVVDPGVHIELPRPPSSIPKALTEEQVVAVLGQVHGVTAADYRDRAILEVLYGTGVRISELCGMSLGDVDLDDAMTRVVGKGDKERLVPLGRFAVTALVEWLGAAGRPKMVPAKWRRRDDASAVFLNQRGGRLSRQGAWGVVRKHAEAAGLAELVHPHVFRHSCATHMLDHGADIRTVQELLGHASLSTTQIYTKVSTDRLRNAYDLAHPRAKFR
jgi:integrase/recombinase XerD